jgi:ABC-type Fe3+/spermidine/putrescine transport system ATPase subunit
MANLIEARVVTASPRSFLLDARGLRISAERRRLDVAPGTDVVLSIRPEHISLTALPGDETSRIRGTVVASLFEGAYVRYWVQAGEREIVVDDPRAGEELGINESVELWLSGARVHVMLPETGHA